MLRWKKSKSPGKQYLKELIDLYNSSKENFCKSTGVLEYLNMWSSILMNTRSYTTRIGSYLCENPGNINRIQRTLKTNFEDSTELTNEIYIYFSKYITAAPDIAETEDKLLFYSETALAYAVGNVLRKCKLKTLLKENNVDIAINSTDNTVTNVAFYRWFYSSLMENSLYSEMWEMIPVSKDTYCKFINKEVKQ